MAREMKSMEVEVALNQPAWLVWQTHMKNFQVTMPATLLNHFKGVEYLDGPPLAPGGVFKISYEEGWQHYEYVTFKWDMIDHEKFCFKATLLDGGVLGTHFHGLVYNYEIVPGGDENSCILKWKIDYDDKIDHDFHTVLQEELTMLSKSFHDHINSLKEA